MPPDQVQVADILDIFRQKGLMLLMVFLTIPFMIPVSIPGVSTAFGAVILLTALWLNHGRGYRVQFPVR